MRAGNPKSKTTNVEIEGTEDEAIRSKHYVLYLSNMTEGDVRKYDVTYCDEKPSEKVCGECSEIHV